MRNCFLTSKLWDGKCTIRCWVCKSKGKIYELWRCAPSSGSVKTAVRSISYKCSWMLKASRIVIKYHNIFILFAILAILLHCKSTGKPIRFFPHFYNYLLNIWLSSWIIEQWNIKWVSLPPKYLCLENVFSDSIIPAAKRYKSFAIFKTCVRKKISSNIVQSS